MIPAGTSEVSDEVLSLYSRVDRPWKGDVLGIVALVVARTVRTEQLVALADVLIDTKGVRGVEQRRRRRQNVVIGES